MNNVNNQKPNITLQDEQTNKVSNDLTAFIKFSRPHAHAHHKILLSRTREPLMWLHGQLITELMGSIVDNVSLFCSVLVWQLASHSKECPV